MDEFMTSQRTLPLHSLTNEDFLANFREKRIALQTLT